MTMKQTISDKKSNETWDNPFNDYFSKYDVNNVDTSIMKKMEIEIEYDNLPKELKTVYDKVHEPEKLICESIQECFKKRHGEKEYKEAKENDCFKITIIPQDGNPISISGKSFEVLKNKDDNNIDIVANNLIRKNRFIKIKEGNQLVAFNGKIYDSEFAESIIEEETENQIEHCKEYQTREVISKIKRKGSKSIKSFDNNPEVITINNGILNIVTGELKNHSPNHYSRILFPVEYETPESDNIEDNLKNTWFWTFLKNSFTVNDEFRKEDFETVLEIMASFLIRGNIDDKAFLFLGQSGKNGKSTLMKYLETMIGTNNVSHTPLQDLAHDQNFLAELQDKVANMFGDIESDELKHSGKLKELVTDGKITVRKLYQKPFELIPKVKLLFSCNLFPKVKDQSNAWFRRWIIVIWERNFANDKDSIPNLREILCEDKEEMNLVFSNLIPIARKLLKNKKFTYTKKEEDVKKLWLENSNPLEAWIREYTKESNHSTSLREANDFYKDTMYEKGETPVTMHNLNKALEEEYEKTKSNGVRVWLNMGLNKPIQTKFKKNDDT